MQPITNISPDTARAIGELCLAGDWACAQGDLPTLESIIYQLSAQVTEPLHCELASIGELCNADRTRATETWSRLKDRVYHSAT